MLIEEIQRESVKRLVRKTRINRLFHKHLFNERLLNIGLFQREEEALKK